LKDIFYNPEKAKKELEEKQVVNIEQEKRSDYFKKLKLDKKFQKYIIEEILEKEILTNQNIGGSIEAMIASSPEDLKSMLLAKNAALKCAESIKNRILINF